MERCPLVLLCEHRGKAWRGPWEATTQVHSRQPGWAAWCAEAPATHAQSRLQGRNVPHSMEKQALFKLTYEFHIQIKSVQIFKNTRCYQFRSLKHIKILSVWSMRLSCSMPDAKGWLGPSWHGALLGCVLLQGSPSRQPREGRHLFPVWEGSEADIHVATSLVQLVFILQRLHGQPPERHTGEKLALGGPVGRRGPCAHGVGAVVQGS